MGVFMGDIMGNHELLQQLSLVIYKVYSDSAQTTRVVLDLQSKKTKNKKAWRLTNNKGVEYSHIPRTSRT